MHLDLNNPEVHEVQSSGQCVSAMIKSAREEFNGSKVWMYREEHKHLVKLDTFKCRQCIRTPTLVAQCGKAQKKVEEKGENVASEIANRTGQFVNKAGTHAHSQRTSWL